MGTRHTARRPARGAPSRTRERVVAAVRELLQESSFHEATVEQVAARAGVSRATLYQHFGSRLGLVDAICETFDANPELVAVREAVRHPEAAAALERSIAHTVAFWASEEAVLEPLYGAAAIDAAAGNLVARQRADRRAELGYLLGRLEQAGRLRPELSSAEALGVLLVLTSFETFQELRRLAGLEERHVTAMLQAAARSLLAG
ncbi:MAG TPA: helix-turn-helix domain-containing protein [Gaiellales bacterium]|jgi:AcrR family transcriptional regulator|nr:helix-turn-helix domain-containing protein [Gaiellales bacterium]